MKTIYIVTGQTATGKSDYAREMAQKYNGELINCDSRQAYKELNIVTGKDINHGQFQLTHKMGDFDIGYYKVPLENGRSTKIWLYDILSPNRVFSSIEYVSLAIHVINDVLKRGKTPIIVGGTYFYLQHLLYTTPIFENRVDWDKRSILETKSIEELQIKLKEMDTSLFESMNNSDRNNPRRLIRRIEILEEGNKDVFMETLLDKKIMLQEKLALKDIYINITGFYRENREETKQMIMKRVKKRINDGAILETQSLLKKYSYKSPGLQSIGYSQIYHFLKNEISEEKLIEDWTNKEYQYAKRQYTFMRQDQNISWINIA